MSSIRARSVRRFFIVPLVLALMSVAAVGCGDSSTLARQLEVEDFRYLKTADGTRVLRGVLFNPTDEVISNVQIEVSLLDADNQRIDKAFISVSDVGPDGRTPFRHVVNAAAAVQGARIRQVRVL